MTDALVFPGQGSQTEGMARPWLGHPASERWREAADVLGWDVVRLGTDASARELRDPHACQVALLVHHAVLLEAWREIGEVVDYVAGHSLGEYSALLAAGVLDFPDALRLVDARARLTAAAAARQPGGMAACLGSEVEEVARAAVTAGVHLANDNAPGQVVVSGTSAALDRFAEADLGGRVVRLEVGAGYHSPLMDEAVEPFRAVLADTPFRDAQTPVVANVDARPCSGADEWPQLLAAGLTAPVRWRETVLALFEVGVTEVTELAATPVLSGLVKRTAPTLRRRVLTLPDDMVAAMGVVA